MQQRNKYTLSKSFKIQRFLAGFFLVLFAFTITPKKLLHSLVANHQDEKASERLLALDATHLSRSSLNCQTDNPISEPPFFTDNGFQCNVSVTQFSFYLNHFVQSHNSAEIFSYGLRGPPAC